MGHRGRGGPDADGPRRRLRLERVPDSDRRGLITGIAVGGFGAGALVTAPIATRLIERVGVLQTFAYLGIGYLIVTPTAGWFMSNPPDGWRPEGWTSVASPAAQRAARDC